MGTDDAGRVRVGTRGSHLALWQTDHVMGRLAGFHPSLAFERELMGTVGDRVLDQPLAEIGDKGLFTKELEDALLDGRIDLAVHSLKDLPTGLAPGLAIVAVLEREDPRDVLVSPSAHTVATLPRGAVVGTSSLRRRAQVLARRPDLDVRDLRGNVPTRLAKVERGDYAAAVMAHAGLLRLSRTESVSEVLGLDVMLPAVGQGALAVEARAGDERMATLLAPLEHRATRWCTTAERALLARLEGGCQVPVAALATLDGHDLAIRGLVASLDGRDVVRDELSVRVADERHAAAAGTELAERLLAGGAGSILERVRGALSQRS